jgi:hypothetical protein
LNVFIRIALAMLFIAAIVPLALASRPLSYHPASAQETCRTFNETGRTVCGRFLEYWQRHGGLPIFGYPISDPFQEQSELDGNTYTVQYFERAVFELHPTNQAPYDVLLSQLGTFHLKRRYPGGQPDLRTPTPALPSGRVMQPKSPRAELGKPYPIVLYTHCGLDHMVDFDGSFWDALEPGHRASNNLNPPPGVGNPTQRGTITLVDEGHARFEFGNRVFYFHRHAGPKLVPGCY